MANILQFSYTELPDRDSEKQVVPFMESSFCPVIFKKNVDDKVSNYVSSLGGRLNGYPKSFMYDIIDTIRQKYEDEVIEKNFDLYIETYDLYKKFYRVDVSTLGDPFFKLRTYDFHMRGRGYNRHTFMHVFLNKYGFVTLASIEKTNQLPVCFHLPLTVLSQCRNIIRTKDKEDRRLTLATKICPMFNVEYRQTVLDNLIRFKVFPIFRNLVPSEPYLEMDHQVFDCLVSAIDKQLGGDSWSCLW